MTHHTTVRGGRLPSYGVNEVVRVTAATRLHINHATNGDLNRWGRAGRGEEGRWSHSSYNQDQSRQLLLGMERQVLNPDRVRLLLIEGSLPRFCSEESFIQAVRAVLETAKEPAGPRED